MSAFSTLLILSSILGEDDDEVFDGVTNGISKQGIPGKVPDIPMLNKKGEYFGYENMNAEYFRLPPRRYCGSKESRWNNISWG